MKNFKKTAAFIAAIVTTICVGTLIACKKAPSAEYVKFSHMGGDRDAYYVSGYWEGMIANGNVLIPETYDGLPVTEIGSKSFKDCSLIKNLTVGDSVYYIGNYAFENCKNLKSIAFGKKLKVLTHNAFTGCKSLKNIDFGSVEELEQSVFENCTALTTVTFPESVKAIDAYAFKGCTNLKTIEFKNTNMENYLNELNSRAFYNCPNLENIIFSENSYPLYSKNNCIIDGSSKELILGGVKSRIPDDGSVTSVNSYSFQGRNITEITVPNSVTRISGYAFENCSITKIYLPENSIWRLKSEFSKVPVTIYTELMTPENIAKHMFEIYPHYEWSRIDL